MRRIGCVIMAAAMLFASLPSLADARKGGGTNRTNEETAIVSWDFDGETALDGWTFFDCDNDNRNWELNEDEAYSLSGSNSITSESFIIDVGVLDPDNWAITPAVDVPKEYTELTFWGRNHSETGRDTFAIYAGISPNPAVMKPITPRMAFTSLEFAQKRIDISAYAGQTVYFAFRHNNSRGQYAFYIDDVAVVTGCEPEVPPENLLFSESFNSNFDFDEWTIVDADGDGHNWQHELDDNSDTPQAYDDTGCVVSLSHSWGTALQPDNWLISPEIALPDDGLELTFMAAGKPPYADFYYRECFSVYVGSEADPDSMELVLDRVTTGQEYQLYTINLSDYAHETIRIAIRHHNCSDENRLRVDCLKVWGSGSYQPPQPDPTIEPLNYGDIDLNGSVEVIDGLMLARYLINSETLSEEQLLLAEVQGNGSITLEDALLIMRYALGSIPRLPIYDNR